MLSDQRLPESRVLNLLNIFVNIRADFFTTNVMYLTKLSKVGEFWASVYRVACAAAQPRCVFEAAYECSSLSVLRVRTILKSISRGQCRLVVAQNLI